MTDIIETQTDADASEQEETTGRRALFGRAAAVAAVAAVAGVSVSRTASAANGGNFIIAGDNVGTLTTSLRGNSTLRVVDGNTTGPTGGVNPRVGSIYALQTAAGRAAIMGEAATSLGASWAVYGRNSSTSGLGVYGLNVGSGGIGVYGEHRASSTESGSGVYGKSNAGAGVTGQSTSGPGVLGTGSTFDFQTGGSGKVLFNNNAFTNPPTGASTAGTIGRDASGNLWYSPASGTYRKLAGTGTAGAFHALSPARLFDSRAAAPSTGPLTTGGTRTLSMADKRDLTTGNTVTANYVPAGATAIACNVTVVNTAGSGFLTVNPGGATEVNAATINWFGAGQILNNGVIVTLNAAREVTVICGGSGASADFVIDVTGYFL